MSRDGPATMSNKYCRLISEILVMRMGHSPSLEVLGLTDVIEASLSVLSDGAVKNN